MALIFRFSCPCPPPRPSNDYTCTLSFLYQVWCRTGSHGKMWWDKRAELSEDTGGNIASLILSVPTFPQRPQHPQCLPASLASLCLQRQGVQCFQSPVYTEDPSHKLLMACFRGREKGQRSFPYILVFQISLTSNTWCGELPYSRLLCFVHCQQIKGRLPPPWFWLQL